MEPIECNFDIFSPTQAHFLAAPFPDWQEWRATTSSCTFSLCPSYHYHSLPLQQSTACQPHVLLWALFTFTRKAVERRSSHEVVFASFQLWRGCPAAPLLLPWLPPLTSQLPYLLSLPTHHRGQTTRPEEWLDSDNNVFWIISQFEFLKQLKRPLVWKWRQKANLLAIQIWQNR